MNTSSCRWPFSKENSSSWLENDDKPLFFCHREGCAKISSCGLSLSLGEGVAVWTYKTYFPCECFQRIKARFCEYILKVSILWYHLCCEKSHLLMAEGPAPCLLKDKGGATWIWSSLWNVWVGGRQRRDQLYFGFHKNWLCQLCTTCIMDVFCKQFIHYTSK